MNTPAGNGPRTAAIWARVSSTDGSQTTDNQLHELRQWAANRGLDVVAEFVTEDSAWADDDNGTSGGKGSDFDAKRGDLLDGARLGRYQVVLCWGLDRMSRRGAEDMLAFVRRLTKTGCALWSKKDPWVEDMNDAFAREMLLSVFATVARFESERRSERILAGLARRRSEGKPVGGGVTGRTDRRPRRTGGYKAAWGPGGSRRANFTEPLTPEQQAEAKEMYAPGPDGKRAYSQPQIAAHFGVSRRQISRYLNSGRKPPTRKRPAS